MNDILKNIMDNCGYCRKRINCEVIECINGYFKCECYIDKLYSLVFKLSGSGVTFSSIENDITHIKYISEGYGNRFFILFNNGFAGTGNISDITLLA